MKRKLIGELKALRDQEKVHYYQKRLNIGGQIHGESI